MSSLLGGPGDRFPLNTAVKDLEASGHWAKRPGPVWLAGVFFPSMLINIEAMRALIKMVELALGWDLGLHWLLGDAPVTLTLLLSPITPFGAEEPAGLLLQTIVWIVPALIIYRLNIGLASVAAPGVDRSERTLRAVWKAGRGLGPTALGMWVSVMALMLGVTSFLFGPALVLTRLFDLDQAPGLLSVMLAPILLLVFAYGGVLLVLHMLAVQSLAQNRRGVGSALTHAWRLIRVEPWAAVRATFLDLSLHAFVLIAGALGGIALSLAMESSLANVALSGALLAAAGTTRASFWARTYHRLGGPLASEQLPGLSETA